MAYYVRESVDPKNVTNDIMRLSKAPFKLHKFESVEDARAYAIKCLERKSRDTSVGRRSVGPGKYIYSTMDLSKSPYGVVYFDGEMNGAYTFVDYTKGGKSHPIFKNGKLMSKDETNKSYIRWQKEHPDAYTTGKFMKW